MTTGTIRQRVVILGGGYAGMLAAARAVRGGLAADVTLVDARPGFVHRISFHEALAGTAPVTCAYAPLLTRHGVRFVQGTVTALDTARQQVSGQDPAGAAFTLDYDLLVVALGSSIADSAPGVAAHAVRLNEPAAISAAHQRLRALAARAGQVLVVGGGLTAIETAAELAERFPQLQITLATSGALGDGFSQRGGAALRDHFAQQGIALREQCGVVALEPQQAHFSDRTSAPFDLCVWNGGITAPACIAAAGLPVDRQGRMLVDATLRAVAAPNVFAVGDAAALTLAGWPVPTGCVSALPMGAHVGSNLRRLVRGTPPAPFSFGLVLRCVSLGRRAGLVQFTDQDGRPREQIWTGRPAAWVKAAINGLVLTTVRNELRTGLPLYWWSQPSRAQPHVSARSDLAGRADGRS